MSKKIYLPFLTILFFSCSDYLPYSSARQTKSITDIPLKQSSENVDCFLNNQTPHKPFYKINIVEVTGTANASYDELIISLKNKAKQEGLDAVMILDKQQEIAYENLNQKIYLEDTTTAKYYRQLATAYQKLSAVGIKYAANINYLDTIVKTAAIELVCNNHKINGTIQFDFYGNPIAIDDNQLEKFYRDSIEPFDIARHNNSAVKDWQYKMNPLLTDEVDGFKKGAEGYETIIVKADEAVANKFYYKISDPVSNKVKKYTLVIERDAAKKITKKTLLQKSNIIWIEEIHYDKNIATGSKRYRVNNNKEEIIFTTINQFYSVNDLPKPLE
ncbi:hypothetical protein [Ferruginibacter sp. SUN106]|uniref:hypothetical protein n=1 Tax=Ferruginibacter sp. SUN106 TaxID=2978348 RepID=UPI003D36F22D